MNAVFEGTSNEENLRLAGIHCVVCFLGSQAHLGLKRCWLVPFFPVVIGVAPKHVVGSLGAGAWARESDGDLNHRVAGNAFAGCGGALVLGVLVGSHFALRHLWWHHCKHDKCVQNTAHTVTVPTATKHGAHMCDSVFLKKKTKQRCRIIPKWGGSFNPTKPQEN